jgi:hypothetical protein
MESTPVHSFSSPRQGSVTVIGKKIFSHSCLSPEVIEENPRYPIPIKVMSRLKRHNTQAKILIKQKNMRNLKIKCMEQPVPPSKTGSIIITSLSKTKKPKEKEKAEKPEKSEKQGKPEKIDLKEIPKPSKKLIKKTKTTEKSLKKPEKSPKRLKKIIQSSIHFLVKKKKKDETLHLNQLKQKLVRKVLIDEINSKIRLENSSKFKTEKFKPKKPWGLDSRKFETHDKLSNIENQRKARRAFKKSPECRKKHDLGLSKFVEVGEEIGLKRCLSTVAKTEVSPVNRNEKRSPDPKVKNFMKIQKKKTRELKRNELIESVRKETKRLQTLKVLDLGSTTKPSFKSKTLKNGRLFRQKFVEASLSDGEKVKKIYDDESSDVYQEEDSQKQQFVSRLGEESAKQNEKDDQVACDKQSDSSEISSNNNPSQEKTPTSEIFKPSENFSPLKPLPSESLSTQGNPYANSKDSPENPQSNLLNPTETKISNKSSPSPEKKSKAASKIQRFFREFLKKKSLFSIDSDHMTEDNEVQEILSAWSSNQQQNPSPFLTRAVPEKLLFLEEMKTKELKEIKEIAKKLPKTPDMLDSLNKMIDGRYQHIADLLQNSTSNENLIIPLDNSNSLNSYKQELDGVKETRNLDFSFPSYRSDKSEDFPRFESEKYEKKEKNYQLVRSPDIQITENFKIDEKLKSFDDCSLPKQDSAEVSPNVSEIDENDKNDSEEIVVDDYSDSSSDFSRPLKVFQPLISRSSPVELSSESLQSIISPDEIAKLSEEVLQTLLVNVLPSFHFSLEESVDLSPCNYIDLIVFHSNSADFESRLKLPLEQSPLEVLSLMHIDEIGYPENFYKTIGDPVLSSSLFSKISSSRIKSIENEEIKFFQKTFDKLIFDTCNEVLNSFRPFGAQGRPLPWVKQVPSVWKKLKMLQVMPKVSSQVNDFNYLSTFQRHCDGNNGYLEGKLRTLIVTDIKDEERTWLDYQFEEVQAEINAAEVVFSELIDEVIRVLRA